MKTKSELKAELDCLKVRHEFVKAELEEERSKYRKCSTRLRRVQNMCTIASEEHMSKRARSVLYTMTHGG